MKRLEASALCLGLALVPAQAMAQESDWSTRLSVYGWASGIDVSAATPRGTVSGELSINDVLSDLKMAFMGAFRSQNGRWSLIGDLVYANIGLDNGLPPNGAGFTGATVDTKMTIGSGYGMYQVAGGARSSLDVGLGLRGISMTVDTKLDPGGVTSSNSDTWVDPVIAARFQTNFTDRWYALGFADAGGQLNGDTTSWQVLGAVGYKFNDVWSAEGGYRYMSIQNSSAATTMDVDLSGPLFGVSMRF